MIAPGAAVGRGEAVMSGEAVAVTGDSIVDAGDAVLAAGEPQARISSANNDRARFSGVTDNASSRGLC